MKLEEQKKTLIECKDSMLAIYTTSKMALEKAAGNNLSGFEMGNVLRSVRFHSDDAMNKLSHHIENFYE